MFVPVVGETSPPISHDRAVEVEVSGAVVRIGQAARTDLVVAVIRALQAQALMVADDRDRALVRG